MVYLSRVFKSHLIVLSLLATCAVQFYGQAQVEFSKQAEEEFNVGLNLYKKAEYQSAAAVFEKVAKSFAPHQRTTAAMVMKAKAELYGGAIADAEKTIQEFLTLHPSSSYTPDAYYTLGLLNVKKKQYEKACESLLAALRSTHAFPSPPLLEEEILVMLDETIDLHIAVSVLQRFVDAAQNPVEEEYLRIKAGEKLFTSGDRVAANLTLENLRKEFSQPTFPERVDALENRLRQPFQLKLGVLLPLAKPGESINVREKEIGMGLREGIETALQEFGDKVKCLLEVRASAGDVVSAARELAEDRSVVAIIGPAFSHEALAAGPVAGVHRVPMVTPTANANGVAAASEFVFQANPDLETRAKAIAQHAIKNLKLKRFAILGSTEPSSKVLAEAFSNEVQRLGCEVMATEWYDRGTTDLMKQLTSMRKKANTVAGDPFVSFNQSITKTELTKLVRLGISMKVLDTLKATRRVVNMADFLGEDAKAKLDAFGIPYSNGDPRIDSLQRIVTAIQGLYCPIGSSEDISIVSSQLAFYGIQTNILGSGEWNNAIELSTNRRYCRGIQFESDYNVDTKSPAYAKFSTSYMQLYNKVPTKYAVLGYDAAKLILSLVQQGAGTREQLKDALTNINGVEGLHARFSFGPRRVNSWLHLFRFANDGVSRISEVYVE